MKEDKKNKGSTGISIEAPTNFNSVVFSEIAAGFVAILEAGAENRLEQSTIQKAIEGFSKLVDKMSPEFTISNCSISMGEN